MSCVRPAILHGKEAWCLKESEMGMLRRTEIHGESNVWNTAQIYTKFYIFDVHAGIECNHRSVGYGKQCSLVWSCLESITF